MKIECGLTGGVYGFIFMTGAARQPCSKSSAAQSCSRAAAAVQRTCPSRRRVGARMFDLASAGPSLYPNRATAETANPGERKQAGVYGETATQLDSTRTAVCTRQETTSERGGHGGVARTGATRARAWVSRNQFGHTLSSWNIAWIDGCQRDWHRLINYWYPSAVGLPVEPPAEKWRR